MDDAAVPILSPSQSCPRMSTVITLLTISTARVEAKAARVNITDAKSRGLVLRGGPEGLVWGHRVQLAGKPCRLVLGTVDRWSIAEARAIANAATDYAKSHKTAPDEAWLQKHLVDTGKIEAPALGEIGGEFPTYAEGRAEYMAAAKHWLSEDGWNSYHTSLYREEMKVLEDRRLPSIDRDDIMEIVLQVHAEHERAAELIISAVRPMWNFMGEDGRRRRYGVEPGIMSPLKNPKRKTNRAKNEIDEDDDEQPWSAGYVPEISELGRIIAVARSGIIKPIPAGAVELVCWTVQRRRAIATARLQDFFDLGDGTGLWRIPAKSRKGKAKRPHTIPLPKVVWDCVVKAAGVARAKDKETKWLFPGARPRRVGMAVTHMSPSTAGHLFSDVPGCGATMHDVRRTMGTHGEQLLGFSRLDAGFVLDHEASVKQSELITSRTAGTGTHDATGVHYSLHDGSHHSWPVMRAWAGALEKAVAEATAALDLKQLAREFGDSNYRVGAKPWGLMPATTPEQIADVDAREKAIRSKVRALGIPDADY